MKVSTEAQIEKFTETYPILAKPIEILRIRASGGHNVNLRIHIAIKRMDTLMPYFVGNPTSRTAWIPGSHKTAELEGTEETRAYAYIPAWSEPLHFLYEWFPGKEEKLGNLLLGVRLEELAYVVIETCNLWYEHRKNLTWESVLGRRPLKAIDSSFVVLLPPKEGTISELFQKARQEGPTPVPLHPYVKFLKS